MYLPNDSLINFVRIFRIWCISSYFAHNGLTYRGNENEEEILKSFDDDKENTHVFQYMVYLTMNFTNIPNKTGIRSQNIWNFLLCLRCF